MHDPTFEPPLPGVHRRTLLTLPLGILASASLPSLAAANHPRDPFERLTERWKAMQGELASVTPAHEDVYLHELAALIAGCPLDGLPSFDKPALEVDGVQSGPAWAGGAIFIVELRLEPGAVVPAHNHAGFDNVSVGIAGACEVRHYEPVGKAPRPEKGTASFQMRETKRVWLTPGRASDLSRTRDNIHWLRAGEEGARLLDFTTRFQEPGDGYSRFSVLELSLQPTPTNVLEARWIGNPYE